MNALWVWIGESTTSTLGMTVWLIVLFLVALLCAFFIKMGIDTKSNTMVGFAIGFLLFSLYLVYRIVGPGLGGYVEQDGVVTAQPVLFLQEAPFNNMWLMVVLIWVQTGFAMVILSAAIKAVPTELTRGGQGRRRHGLRRCSGGSRCRRSHRRSPSSSPSLFVTVMKVFDIVYAMTNGNFGTQVIANQMWITAFGQTNLGLGSAFAVVLFVSVIPIMWINIRRLGKESA